MERPDLRLILSCLLAAGVVLSGSDAFSQENPSWRLKKEANGIRCYTRIVPESGFKEYKAVAKIESTLSGLVALVADMDNAPEWIDTCVEGRVLKRIASNETITYSVNDAPWPVKDRDAAVHTKIRQDAVTKQVTVSLVGISDYLPAAPQRIRVKKLKGFWQFTPKSNGWVEVHYQVHCEPGGHLPSWLVNSVVVEQPYKTLLGMKDAVGKKRYQEKRYTFIEEMSRIKRAGEKELTK
jgi:ribosome-associated toxin RatA of RatAB toxin-antitoxin module